MRSRILNVSQSVWSVAALVGILSAVFSLGVGCHRGDHLKPEELHVVASDENRLENIEWRPITVSGFIVDQLHFEAQPFIKFDRVKKQASGFNGCNNFFGNYEIDGSMLKFGPVAATRRFCEGTSNEVEMKFMQALEKTSSWEIKDEELIFLDNSAVLARFTTVDMDVGKEDVTEIIGMVWRWEQTIYNNDTKTLPAEPDHYTLTLHPDGKVDVRADCNRGGGTYTKEGSRIAINITHTTMAMCPPDSLEEEFLRNLAAAVIYFVQDSNLYFDLKFDTGTMKFSKKK